MNDKVSHHKMIAVVIVMFSTVAAIVAQAPSELSILLSNIEANERLYANIDVIVSSKYVNVLPEGLPKDTVLTRTTTSQYTRQASLFRYNDKTKVKTLKDEQPTQRQYLISYDGEKTRSLQRNPAPLSTDRLESRLANIKIGREQFGPPFLAHIELFQKHSCQVPLSVFLKGGKAHANHPDSDSYYKSGKRSNQTSIVGKERLRGLDCIKVKVETWNTEPNRLASLKMVWLAEDRNYLPIQLVAFVARMSLEKPVAESQADDLTEIAPMVWLPKRYKRTIYDLYSFKEKGQYVESNIEEWKVEKVTLDPKYDIEFFSNVEFPAGTLVSEVTNGQITNTYVTEGVVEKRPAESKSWLWWSILTALFVFLGALGLLMRRRFRMAAI